MARPLATTGQRPSDGAAALVDPVFTTVPDAWDQDTIVDAIVSENVHRRHMNPAQAAAVAIELKPIYEERTRRRQREAASVGGRRSPYDTESNNKVPADPPEPSRHDGESRVQAARAAGASGNAVSTLERLRRDAPDLAQAAVANQISLDAADKQRRRRVAEQRRREPARLYDPENTIRVPCGAGTSRSVTVSPSRRIVPRSWCPASRSADIPASCMRVRTVGVCSSVMPPR